MPSDRGAGNLDPQRQVRSADAAAPPEAVQRQLEAVLSSQTFIHSPQLSRFLRFIVEQEIAGKGGELKEYSLGVQVFRKDESFDPRIDTVVRTEARRLRQKLAEYYQAEGGSNAIEIVLPKGSYRASFRMQAETMPSSLTLAVAKRSARIWWAACALLAIAGGTVYWFSMRTKQTNQALVPVPSIAVLSLENLSADPEQEYFSDGMTDALITNLAKIRALRVISRTSVLQFKRTRKPIPEIARQLGVEYLVEGTVMRAGDRVRITAQLIAARNERHLWAESYEREQSGVLALQSEIARAIANQINIRLTPHEQARLAPHVVSAAAHDLYLKGRFNWQTRDTDRLRKSIEYFNQAIELEPGYALAYAGLADSYSVLLGRSDGPERKDLEIRSCAAARKAVELDGELGEAHTSLAVCKDDWNWQEQEQQLRRALELSPGYATAHQWLGAVLTNTGRLDAGLAEARRAAELDPLAPAPNMILAWALYMARQYDRSIAQSRRTIEMYPGNAQLYVHLGIAYQAKGMHREALDTLDTAMKLTGGAPPVAAVLAHIHAVAGDTQPARRLLAGFEKRGGVTPIVMALLYLDTGGKDHAFEWLARGVEQRSLYINELKVEPMFDSLHSDPRFATLLRKMNLPD